MEKILRFGVMANGTSFKAWQAEGIRSLMAHPAISLEVLIIHDNPPPEKHHFKHLGFRIYNRLFFQVPALEAVDLSSELTHIPEIRCKTQRKKYTDYFEQADIDEVKSLNLDFILRFGFNIIRGEMLKAATNGIWSFHHGDEQRYRGGPAGFWEIYKNDPLTGVILQRLTSKLDGGIILKKAFFGTLDHDFAAHYGRIMKHSTFMPLQACKDLLEGNASYLNESPTQTTAPIFRLPHNLQMALMAVKLFRNKIRFHLRQLFRVEKWNIAVVDQSVPSILENGISPDKTNWFSETGNTSYIADPFALEDGTLVYEKFMYRDFKACIETDKANTELIEPYHLSYPFAFFHDGKQYVMPEGFESNRITLYEYRANHKNFLPIGNLLENVQAVDPTLYHDGTTWWLFFTPKEPANTALLLYFSENLLGPYHPHPKNPVKMDIRGSRPAGPLFRSKNKLYRPAQNCSKTYGGSLVIHEVTTLSKTDFQEKKVKEILPLNDTAYHKGLHTLSPFGEKSLVDGKKYIFSFANFRYQVKRKLKKVF